ncbi:exodeoxyribonuclease VII small subunit [Candidatus Saccharibacteria bacterium]|nr:exodeoxyribonuclease VII small subunit [Candidatus Saccharibacteria bacterium]
MSETKKSLNQKIEQLDAEVEWFYSDDFKLENAVEKYKSAMILAKEIEKDLDNLKNEIEILSEDFAK